MVAVTSRPIFEVKSRYVCESLKGKAPEVRAQRGSDWPCLIPESDQGRRRVVLLYQQRHQNSSVNDQITHPAACSLVDWKNPSAAAVAATSQRTDGRRAMTYAVSCLAPVGEKFSRVAWMDAGARPFFFFFVRSVASIAARSLLSELMNSFACAHWMPSVVLRSIGGNGIPMAGVNYVQPVSQLLARAQAQRHSKRGCKMVRNCF